MVSIDDTAMRAVAYALDGLQARADVHADNIANLNTPGFRASRVDFESTLRRALLGGDDAPLPDASVVRGLGLPDAAGNTVSLEDELTTLMRTSLMQKAMTNAFNFKVGVLRTAITGR